MHETVFLTDPESPLRVEYSRAAMEQIRERARVGLMAAPRVGMGIGGLLLGMRQNGRIRIVDSVEIPCCHSGGPSFKLTPEEMQTTREMMTEAGEITATSKIAVIGWFCSKTRGDAVLNEFDLQFHDELFPEAWKIAVVLRPTAAEPMRAVFFFRDETGAVVKGVENEVDEWAPPADPDAPPVESAAAPVTPAEPGGNKPIELLAPRPVSKIVEMTPPAARLAEAAAPAVAMPASNRPAETTLADIIVAGASGAGPKPVAPVINVGLFGVPGFMPLGPLRKRSKLYTVLPIAATALAVFAAAYFTKDSWLPRPPLSLTSSEVSGSLLIRWNTDAVRGIDHATMYVSDGTTKEPQTVALDHFQLSSGLLNYTLKSQRVTAKLDAGDVNGITVWFAPASAEPAPVATTSPAPTGTAPAPTGTATPVSAPPALTGTAPAQDGGKLTRP
jgi:hypothetical protein